MKINENTIMLGDLGFETFYEKNNCELFIAITDNNIFKNFETVWVGQKNNFVSFETFQKIYNEQIKKNEPDLVVNKIGKVLKINYYNPKLVVYNYGNSTPGLSGIPLGWFTSKNISINEIDCYVSKEACKKAEKRNIIRRKLEALAFELNGNKDIDWGDEKWKYYIYYDNDDQLIITDCVLDVRDMNIHCYSKDFKDKAIELIGEEDLKEYLINC